MNKPMVAIVGRPNVGKSTLFNKVVGKRIAIVEDMPGVTRDRIYAEAEWTGHEFVIVDTGGLLLNDADPMKAEVSAQAEAAMEEADVILFMVDAAEGPHPLDNEIADHLRGSKKPIIVVANKADNDRREQDAMEFYSLGIGQTVFPISAHNGRMVADLLDEVVRDFPAPEPEPEYGEDTIKIAIVGRPNVGKSSLVNAILGQRRAIVSDIPGTTRDAVDSPFEFNDKKLVLIDTGGIRRAGKVQGSIEYYIVLRALRSIERADVTLILIDANDGLRDGDKRVMGFSHEAGKPCVIVVNKWDLCPEESMRMVTDDILRNVPYISYAPVVFTSAKTGYGVTAAVDTAIDVVNNAAFRVPTSELNEIMQDAVDKHPHTRGGRDLRIKYATMADVNPPSIQVFVNDPELVHFTYARYLENQIRKKYPYEGTPIRLSFRRPAKKEKGK